VTSYYWLLARGGFLLASSVNSDNFIRVLGDEIRVLIDNIERLLATNALSDSVSVATVVVALL